MTESTFKSYVDKVKENVYSVQRQSINKETFLDDIKICQDYLKIIDKMKENDFFPKEFTDYLIINLYDTSGVYSLITLNSYEGNNSWNFMAPELQENYYISFLQVKSWIEKIKEDKLIK